MGVTGNPIALTITWSFALFPDANVGNPTSSAAFTAAGCFLVSAPGRDHGSAAFEVHPNAPALGQMEEHLGQALGHVRAAPLGNLHRGSGLVCRRVPRRSPSTTRPGMIWSRPTNRKDSPAVNASITQAFRKRFVHSFNTANKAREAHAPESLQLSEAPHTFPGIRWRT